MAEETILKRRGDSKVFRSLINSNDLDKIKEFFKVYYIDSSSYNNGVFRALSLDFVNIVEYLIRLPPSINQDDLWDYIQFARERKLVEMTGMLQSIFDYM